jgi:signal transduction histidine kinase
VKKTLLNVRNTLAILVVAGTVVAAIFVGAVGAALLKPLTILTRSARQIEQGNLDLSVPIRSRDEIGHLADAFNSMARELREARRLDRNKIARTEQTTQLAIDNLPDAILLLGPEGRVEMSNPAARKYFGILPGTTAKACGHDWLTRLHAQVCTGGISVVPDGYESAIQLFDNGNERFFLPRAVPIFGENQAIIGMTAILVDVTRLRHSDEARSDLVSTVSHELRTPLTSLRMSILLLAEERFGPLTARQAKLLNAASEESDRLYRIIENLLTLSRMESGRIALQFRALGANDIVAQAVEPLRGSFVQKGLRLHVEVAGDAPTVEADPSQLGYALANVLGNALKFTPAPGDVSVSLRAAENSLCIDIEDTGPGIAAEYSQRIFEKFFRIPGQSASVGVGLGLAIARRIIESHHGNIEYISSHAGGSCFRILLPTAPLQNS